ncbi:hypothetical protein C5B42_02580 [Candidatus Cerribacteria bacterium 'Amazon FNV 2010 28 9']|uniref:Uncharacterized protein n=1 Tax=Candidatus Cerribacteria bacterium 'Amazon FNV 2010 28 9' TaxID=2081795 RepID=A0A317JQC0_9BACT|nr:MAG: hypothetical protein C5B42_02580 [Candidatus Cerribacteria bacterium 'Amazon FNV 2010 28 9']
MKPSWGRLGLTLYITIIVVAVALAVQPIQATNPIITIISLMGVGGFGEIVFFGVYLILTKLKIL